MNQPPFEVADIVRAAGKSFIENNRSRLAWQHLRVLRAIERCRTAALGGHLDQCSRCGHQAISYNSCRNRHCAKCQTNARDQWLAARQTELLDVPYVHVVFTLPHELSQLALSNKKVLYDLLFRASAATLLEIAADPKHLGADIGFMSVLHTWGQNVLHHPHAHCVIPAGGLSLDHEHWIHPRYAFFLPVKVLRRVFRGKFTAGLKRAFRKRQLTFPGVFSHSRRNGPSVRSFDRYFAKIGSCTRSLLSEVRSTYFIIWLATHIALPFPTTGLLPSRMAKSLSAGRTTRTAASRSS